MNPTTVPTENPVLRQQEFLPHDFAPGKGDVLVGRGKKCHHHSGNKKLHQIIKSKLEEYSASTCKHHKSTILSSVSAHVRKNGGFVKQDPITGRWYDVGDKLARCKISQVFRDALHDKYRSSYLSRKNMRKEKKTYNYSQTQSQIVNFHMERIRELCNQRQDLLQSHNMSILDSKLPSSSSASIEEISASFANNQTTEHEYPFRSMPTNQTYKVEVDPFEPIPISKVFQMENDAFLPISNTGNSEKWNDPFEPIKLSDRVGSCFEHIDLSDNFFGPHSTIIS